MVYLRKAACFYHRLVEAIIKISSLSLYIVYEGINLGLDYRKIIDYRRFKWIEICKTGLNVCLHPVLSVNVPAKHKLAHIYINKLEVKGAETVFN